MADIKEKIVFDDSDLIKGLTNQFSLITKVDKALRDTELSYKEAFDVAQKQLDETSKATEEATASIVQHVKATAEAKKESTGFKGVLKDIAGEINIMGHNLGGVISNLKAKATAMKAVASSVNLGTGAMKAFKIALAGTGIGLLVIALGSLVAMFSKSEKAINKVSQIMAGFGAAIGVIIDRAVKFGGAIVKLFSGDFKGAFSDAKESVTGLTAEMAKEVAVAVQLERRLQALNDANRDLIVTNEKRKSQISELLLLASDQAASDKDRVKALKEAAVIQKQIDEDAVKSAKEAFEIERTKQLNRDEDTRDKEALAQAEAAFIAAQREANESQIGFTRRISGLEEEQRSKREAAFKERQAQMKEINEALDQQIKKITDAADKLANEQLDPESRLRAEANIALAIIDGEFKKLEALAKAAGKEVDLTQDKADLILAIEKHLQRDIEKLRNEGITKLEGGNIKALKVTERGAVDIVGNVKKAVDKMADAPEVRHAFLTLSEKLQKAFDIDEDTANQIFKGIGSVFNEVFASMTAGTDRAIEKNAELIDSLKAQEEEANNQLEKELERQELGLANNVAGEKKRIETLKKQQADAEKEAEKLRKKQLATQLIADGIAQGSNIVTMISNVLASPGVSLLGPAGIPIALATIAAFLAILSKIKAGQKKLYTGGPLDQDGGFVNQQGRTDKNGGRGHRIEDSNLVVGGREFVVNEDASAEHSAFLADLNAGKFAGKNLRDEMSRRGIQFAINGNADHDHDSAIIQAASARHQERLYMQAVKDEVKNGFKELIGVIKEQPDTVAYRPGDILRKETPSGVKIIQTEEDWKWEPERRRS